MAIQAKSSCLCSYQLNWLLDSCVQATSNSLSALKRKNTHTAVCLEYNIPLFLCRQSVFLTSYQLQELKYWNIRWLNIIDVFRMFWHILSSKNEEWDWAFLSSLSSNFLLSSVYFSGCILLKSPKGSDSAFTVISLLHIVFRIWFTTGFDF